MSTALTNAKQFWTTNPQHLFTGSMPTEAGGIMEIVMDETVYTVSIAANGSWSWQPPFPLAEGPHNLSVRTIDRAGNVGAPSLLIVNVDLTAPDQPLIIGIDDNAGDKTGPVSSGQQTDDRTPTLKGVAEPDSIVRLYNEQNQLIGSVKASSSGYWEITPTLADGEHALYVTATDGRGYVSQASEVFTLTVADDTAVPVPGKVEITHAQDDAGAAQGKLLDGALTDDTTPTLHGTAPAGSNVLIQYRDVNGQWVDGGYATLSGTQWSWTPDQALGEGKWEFRAYAGSGWTDEFTLEIDLTPQSELAITHAWDDFGINTGLLHSGAITDDRTPTLNGRAEANSLVYIHFRSALGKWELLDSVQVQEDGNWSLTSDRLALGSYDFYADLDLLPKEGHENNFTLQIIEESTFRPEILYAIDNVGSKQGKLNSGSITDDPTPTFSGKYISNSLVDILLKNNSNGETKKYQVMTNEKGEWIFTPPFSLPEGYWKINAQSPENNLISSDFNLTRVKSDLPDRFTEDFSSYKDAYITGPLLVKGGRIDFSGTDAEIRGGNDGKRFHLGDTTYKTAKFIFTPDYLTNEVSFYQRSAMKMTTTSVKVSLYDEGGELIYEKYITSEGWSKFNYKSEQGVLISEMIVTVSKDFQGTDFDDITYKPIAPRHSSIHDSVMSYDDDTGEKELSSLNFNIETNSDEIHGRTFTYTLKDVLSSENKELFINNDRLQDISQAQQEDIVQLKDLNINDTQSWTHQTGTVTIAGVQYEVYSHNGSDAELLVQEGVKVELI